jgi:hypothetical protein
LICPSCHAEYVPGVTRCSDCGTELVQELPPAASRLGKPRRRPPAPPDVSAYEAPAGSRGWFARHALLCFLALPLVAYVIIEAAHITLPGTVSVATGLSALLVCWAVGARQNRPARLLLRFLVFGLVTAGYAVALAASSPLAPAVVTPAHYYLPLALVAGLLAQGTLARNAGLRRLAQPLTRLRASWYVYAPALLALPLLAVLVVWLSRHLPGATSETADRAYVAHTLRIGWLDALVMAPWALAWFGYGVPVLLRRHSALLAALTLGVLTWLHLAISLLVHGHVRSPEPLLNLGRGVAVAVVAVWLFQRARGSVWPVIILEGTTAVILLLNWAGDGFGAGLYSSWTALVAAEAALAAVLVAVGRMWQRAAPTASSRSASQLTEDPGDQLVAEHSQQAHRAGSL